jgi:hypothetical protein
LIGAPHVGLYRIIEAIKEEENRICGTIELINSGEPRVRITPQQNKRNCVENWYSKPFG